MFTGQKISKTLGAMFVFCWFQVKRLWERAAFLAKRNIAMKDCLTTLKALNPIFGHWVAELGQIAAHAETLQNMLKRGLQDPVLSDVEAFGRDLSSSTVSTVLVVFNRKAVDPYPPPSDFLREAEA